MTHPFIRPVYGPPPVGYAKIEQRIREVYARHAARHDGPMTASEIRARSQPWRDAQQEYLAEVEPYVKMLANFAWPPPPVIFLPGLDDCETLTPGQARK